MPTECRSIIMGNWKMNNTLSESRELVRQLNMSLSFSSKVEIVVCPPFTTLQTVRENLDPKVRLGAQNVYPALSGAFTGEISPRMLKELRCDYVLVGHSERRQLFGEDDNLIAAKVAACLANGITPVLCVGETLAQRQGEIGQQVVLRQLREGLKEVSQSNVQQMVIAYEPVWAIGTGQAASPGQVAEMVEELHRAAADVLPVGCAIRFLYGGSVTPENIRDFLTHELINGALVGGVSLKAEHFAEVVRLTGEIRHGA